MVKFSSMKDVLPPRRSQTSRRQGLGLNLKLEIAMHDDAESLVSETESKFSKSSAQLQTMSDFNHKYLCDFNKE